MPTASHQPAMSLHGALPLRCVGGGPEAELDVLALVLADAVAVAVGVAGVVEDRVGLRGIVGAGLALRRRPGVVRVAPVARRQEGVAGYRVAAVGELGHLLTVDGVLERDAEVRVPQGGVAAGLALVAVEADVVPVVVAVLDRLDARRRLELLELRRREQVGAVDGAALQVLDHRVAVLVDDEHDLVDGRRAEIEVLVGLQAQVLVPVPLHDLERPAADAGRVVLEGQARLLGASSRPRCARGDRGSTSTSMLATGSLQTTLYVRSSTTSAWSTPVRKLM